MSEKDNIKTFIDEMYSSLPEKSFSTKKKIYNHIDEIWSIDLADFSDKKTSINKCHRHTLFLIDDFCKYLWAISFKIKYSQTITNEFSNTLTTSKRRPLKLESD